jgi:hypothetical protein
MRPRIDCARVEARGERLAVNTGAALAHALREGRVEADHHMHGVVAFAGASRTVATAEFRGLARYETALQIWTKSPSLRT